jgi:glutamyl-tRNA synthetase
LPDAVLNYLVRFGWSHGDQEVFSKTELIDAFNWEACGRGDGKFDAKKFLAIQQAHMKDDDQKGAPLTSLAQYTYLAREFLGKRGIADVDEAQLTKAIPAIRQRARTFVEAADMLDFFFREPPVMDEKARQALVPETAERIRSVLDGLRDIPDEAWPEGSAIHHVIQAHVVAEKTRGLKDVMQPVRIALSGRTATPDLTEILKILGKPRSLARLEQAIAMAEGRAQ